MEIMSLSQISPDQVIFWQWGFITINATMFYTWVVMAILVVGSWLVTRNLSREIRFSRWQNMMEVIISGIRNEIREIAHDGEKVHSAHRHTVSLHRAVEPARHRAGHLPGAHCVDHNNCGARGHGVSLPSRYTGSPVRAF